jgi:hypothetical protein
MESGRHRHRLQTVSGFEGPGIVEADHTGRHRIILVAQGHMVQQGLDVGVLHHVFGLDQDQPSAQVGDQRDRGRQPHHQQPDARGESRRGTIRQRVHECSTMRPVVRACHQLVTDAPVGMQQRRPWIPIHHRPQGREVGAQCIAARWLIAPEMVLDF